MREFIASSGTIFAVKGNVEHRPQFLLQRQRLAHEFF